MLRHSLRRVGIAFDIDGVLYRGGKVFPETLKALELVDQHKIPHVYMTNGGGVLESKRAASLGQLLNRTIEPEQVILSHTPLRRHVAEYADENVLVLGRREYLDVMRSYGFRRAITPHQLSSLYPDLFPFHDHALADEGVGELTVPFDPSKPFKAVFIVTDPVDWHVEVQVVTDVLTGAFPPPPSSSSSSSPPPLSPLDIPIFNTNNDFVFSASYPYPRFAQGPFSLILTHLLSHLRSFHEEHGSAGLAPWPTHQITHYGKPYKVTYDLAEEKLRRQAANNEIDVFYGIGDNAYSDIKGANDAGDHWRSILVRTGLFNDPQAANHPKIPADFVCQNVLEAVETILHHHT